MVNFFAEFDAKRFVRGNEENVQGENLPLNKYVDGNEINKRREFDESDIAYIEQTPFSALLEQNRISTGENDMIAMRDRADETAKNGLTPEEKAKILEDTNWSESIVDMIASFEEYEIYKKAGLREAEINGKKCLIRDDIDLEQKDADGISNDDRMKRGLAPITQAGKIVELHHIGQHNDAPLAELTADEHRGAGNDSILHDKTKESEIDRNRFANERGEHWKERARSVDHGRE
jgi:hypothetical protein